MDSIQCIKFSHQLVDNLNIVYNVTSGTIVFWNRYQIFLFDELKYENLTNGGQAIYFPEFNVASIILSNNYLICLVDGGNVYLSPLKFKQTAQKRFKSSFQKCEEDILCIDSSDDVTYSLKKKGEILYFCVHKISSEYSLLKNFTIQCDNVDVVTSIHQNKMIFNCCTLNETEFAYIKDIFTIKDEWDNQMIVIFSFDKLSLYAILVPTKLQESLNPLKLFTSPSKISNINFTHESALNILVSLACGTLIKLTLNEKFKTPLAVHLNTAIQKLHAIKNTMIYTDGITFWKMENTFSDSSFRQFKVRQVKDFIKVGDQIICTTYAKFIYLLSLDDENCYIQPPVTSNYCPSDYVLNNSEYLYKIIEAVEENNQIIKVIKKEENYLTTLALSNRQDIMNDMIQYKVVVFDNYEDLLQENIPLKFTDAKIDYFDINNTYFLIKISTEMRLQQKFSEILSNFFGNLMLHITLISEEKVLKTTSIRIVEQLKSLNAVIALRSELNLTNVNVQIKLITNIPGALNDRETLWIPLHTKNIILGPENFIKATFLSNNVQFLKEPTKSISDLIHEFANNYHGELFKITQNSNSNNPIKWSFYVNLPTNYQVTLKNRAFLIDQFNNAKANYLCKELSSEGFLKSRNSLCFIIGRFKIELDIINDGISEPLLKVNSENKEIAFCMRNFFSNLAHNSFVGCEREFVSNALYESIENIEKNIKSCILNQKPREDFLRFFEQYQRNVIGSLIL